MYYPNMGNVEEFEAQMFKVAEDAYFKACETSDPQHWMEAAMLAQQHRNALNKMRKWLDNQNSSGQDKK